MGHQLTGAAYRRKFETKEHDPASLDPEFKKLWDGFLKNFKDFKDANDERFKSLGVTLKPSIDTLIEEKVNRINSELDKQQKLIDAAIAEMKKAPQSTKAGERTPAQMEYRSAFETWFRKGITPANMNDMAEKAFNQYKALMEGSNPDGGWLTTPEVDLAVDRVARNVIAFRGLAQVRQLGAPKYTKFISLGGAAAGWVGETTARTETATPTLEQLNFDVGEMYAEPRATQTILDDANINIEQWLADEVGITFAEMENTAFITGNGAVGKPKGVLSYPVVDDSAWAWGSVGKIHTGGAADFAAANPADAIKDLITSLKIMYRNGAQFIMHRQTVGKIRKFKDTAGGTYLWQPGLQAGDPSLIDGYPHTEDDYWPVAGAGNYIMGFGNWSRSYLILDRVGIRVLRDPYTAKPYIKFYTTKRVGGGVQNFESYKLLSCEV